jgi:hypothetical protein
LLVGFKGTYPNVEYWEEPTPAMIFAVRQLRTWLMAEKRLAIDHQMRQHNQMPGAATSCPGDAVKAVWNELCSPIVPIPPSNTIEDDMQVPAPSRVYDSRNDAPLKGGETRTIQLGTAAAAAKAAQVNLTAIGKTAAGYIVAFGTATPPATSNVNFQPGQVQANTAIVQVTGGAINVQASVDCDLIVDLQALWP